MKRSGKYYSKKIHRYLGVFIGIQFFFWTLGGFYFSWTNINEIRGDHLREQKHELPLAANLVSPDIAFAEIRKTEEIAALLGDDLVRVVGRSDRPVVRPMPITSATPDAISFCGYSAIR